MTTNLFNFGPVLDAILAAARTSLVNESQIIGSLNQIIAGQNLAANDTAGILAALKSISTNEDKIMALIDDENTALAALNTAIAAVSANMTQFAADLAAALANNDTMAAQTALAGINAAAAALNSAVAANQAP